MTYGGTAITTNPSTITTDSTGSFAGSITVPSSSLGTHTVKATDASSNSASAQFTVTTGTITPSISLNPTSGPTGTTVNISGTNFAPNSGITITYDNAGIATTPTTITSSSTGSFTGSIVIPSSSSAGAHTVKATDASAGSASASFTVTTVATPTISLNPSSGPTGTTVNISGSGFASNSKISITYGGTTITTNPSTITTDSTGSFAGSITIPPSSLGTHTVKATDASANSASAQFTVTRAISLSPSSGLAGTVVKVTGSNFAGGSRIIISYDGTRVSTSPGKIKTDGSGTFSA